MNSFRVVFLIVFSVLLASCENIGVPTSKLEHRANVSALTDSNIPDHVSEPVGPAPSSVEYEGSLEPGNIYRIQPNPNSGFHWPYLLYVPTNLKDGMPILVEPNNDGLWGAPFETHEYWAAIRIEQLYIDFGRHLGTPLLTPIFPRPLVEGPSGNLYVHALTREAMEAADNRVARPDLQLVSMLDDARSKLAGSGHQVPEDALFWGFSASADFVTRMAFLHPTRVRAVAAGGLGGFPILPTDTYDGAQITYPVGVADLSVIADGPLNDEALRATPILLFQGGDDENDSVPEPPLDCSKYGSDSYNCEQAQFVNSRFGASTVERLPLVREVYEDFGMEDFHYLLLMGVDHSTPDFFVSTLVSYYSCILQVDMDCAKGTTVPGP